MAPVPFLAQVTCITRLKEGTIAQVLEKLDPTMIFELQGAVGRFGKCKRLPAAEQIDSRAVPQLAWNHVPAIVLGWERRKHIPGLVQPGADSHLLPRVRQT